MSADDPVSRRFEAEMRRLQLEPDDLPGALVVSDGEAFEQLISLMQALEPPVTWRDVFPDLPAHWVPGRPETWTTRYRPFGPYDYQSLPTGPAVHVTGPRPAGTEWLERFVEEARQTGFAVHGAGFIEGLAPHDAFVVLDCDTTTEQLDDFIEWLLQHTHVELAAIPRSGDEQYVV